MDVHHHHHPPYAPSDGHLPPAYDPSHPHSYEAQFYSSYLQPQYEYNPSASYSHHHGHHNQYYDYSAAYQLTPPGVDHAHPHHYLPPPQPQPDGMEVAAGFPHEYAVLMVDGGNGGNGGNGGVSSQGGGDRFPFRGQGGRKGGRGGVGRGNFRGRGRGRGGGRAREPAQPQPPAPKPARQPTPHAWCDICRVDCNSIEILEQHKAGKRHKRTVQRIQEYEAQQKQLAGSQSAVITTGTGETVPFVPESVTQTLTVPVAASATAVASEAGSSNHPGRVEIREEQKETVGQNQPATEGPSESLNTKASETHKPPPSETNQEDAAPSGKRSFTKRPRPDGYGLGFIYGYGGGRFDRGGRRGGRFDRGGKKPRRFGDHQPWPTMAAGMPMMPPYRMTSPMPGSGPASRQRVRPIVCMLCNISCNTPAVFETHVAGKKHQTRISKCQGPNQVFGPLTIFIPPGQPTPHPQKGPEPVFYGLTTPEEIKQHEMLIQDEMEDGDEEACGDDHQDGNPEERAEDDGQDIAVTDNGTNDATDADQSAFQNELAMGPTPGTADSIATDENQNTEVAPSHVDVVADVQTTSELS